MQLNDVQYKVMMWKDMIMDFATSLEDMEHKIRKKVLSYQLSITSTMLYYCTQLQMVQQKLQNWITQFRSFT